MTTHIAFIGIGLMGAPMATNLLAADFDITVWNRTRSKAEALRSIGAKVADSPAAAAAAADVLITMLDSGPIVDAVLFGEGKVAEALSPGKLVVDMSSIPPATARHHAARLRARGVGYLDAPVSGGTAGAMAATLAIMVGGNSEDFARATPIFEKLGRPTHVGPCGSGQLTKLCNQVIVAVTIGAVSEALLLAAAGGVDPVAMRRALLGGFADSRILNLHGQRMLERNFVPGGFVKNQLKDCETALAAAEEVKLTLPLAERATALFRALRDHGGAEYDHSALLLEIERLNHPRRVGEARDQLPEQK